MRQLWNEPRTLCVRMCACVCACVLDAKLDAVASWHASYESGTVARVRSTHCIHATQKKRQWHPLCPHRGFERFGLLILLGKLLGLPRGGVGEPVTSRATRPSADPKAEVGAV